MQKFVTICLHCHDTRHGAVEEHLTQLLADGWRVASVSAIGSAPAADATAVWVAVVLENDPPVGPGQIMSGSHAARAGFSPFGPMFELPRSDEGKPVEPHDIPVGPDTPLEVGSRVLSYSQGRWWRAEVVGFEDDDRVKVHFPGWDSKWDVVVARDDLQVDLHAADE
jgi:hypothetical protein